VRCYIGYDPRERIAARVAEFSLLCRSSIPIESHRIDLVECKSRGLFWRPQEKRNGQLWDVISDAPCSTEFSISRFLVPVIQHEGWALFTDCDVVFLGDVAELAEIADPRKAVMVVKHDHAGDEGTKMDGQIQARYARKNWSSVVLWNCGHSANRRLGLGGVNNLPGRALHQFCWLEDSEIGELPPEWNWLVGVQPKPAEPKLAHFTLGGPFLPNWPGGEYDHIWKDEHARHCHRTAHG
jgi:hypothetical protein